MMKLLRGILIVLACNLSNSGHLMASVPNGLVGSNIYYVNGINTEDYEAENSATQLAARLGVPAYELRSIYNSSSGLLLDVLETYQAANYDGGENNTLRFWKWMDNIGLMPDPFLLAYYSIYTIYNSTPFSMRADLASAKSIIDLGRQSKGRALIISHSQGNIFTNFLVDEITQDDNDTGTQCTGNVAVATPATYVSNDDPWITNINDDVINVARLALPYGSNILPANVNNVPFDVDPSGHEFNDTYLRPGTEALQGILNAVDTVATRLEQDCELDGSCGQALQPSGGQGVNQNFTYYVSNSSPHNLTISFEAYHIPDRLKVYTASGQLLYDTRTQVSGFHQHTISYDPATHGTLLDVFVDAPYDGTAWKFCIDCQQSGSGCDLLQGRKNVSYSFNKGDHNWSCSVNNLQVDNQPLSNTTAGSVLLSKGEHMFSMSGGCTCTSRFGRFCNNRPYVRVNNVRYDSINSGFMFNVN